MTHSYYCQQVGVLSEGFENSHPGACVSPGLSEERAGEGHQKNGEDLRFLRKLNENLCFKIFTIRHTAIYMKPFICGMLL